MITAVTRHSQEGYIVAKGMGCDAFFLERRAALTSDDGVFADQVLDAVATERPATSIGKQGVHGLAAAFVKPGTECRHHVFSQRCTACFAPFAEAADMGATSEHHILAAQPDQLRDPQPGLCRQKQKRAIPAPKPVSRVRCCNQRFNLLMGEEGDGFVLETLARYRQDALDQGTHARFVESRIAEEGMHRRQAVIARAGTIAALVFEMICRVSRYLGLASHSRWDS